MRITARRKAGQEGSIQMWARTLTKTYEEVLTLAGRTR